MLTDTEREHIEKMAEAARGNAFRDPRLLNRMLAEHTATLLAEIDRLRGGDADAVEAAITCRVGPRHGDIDPRALAEWLARLEATNGE